MIDLNMKPKQKNEEPELPWWAQYIIYVIFSTFFAYVLLSGIVGEPLF